jgi:hypothetical protein
MPQDVLKSLVNMTGLDFYVSGDNLFYYQRDGFNPSSISGASDTDIRQCQQSLSDLRLF